MPAHWLSLIAAGISTLAQFLLFLPCRRVCDSEIASSFVRDVAIKHLPYIYHALRQIAAEQGIELEDPPLVRFVDLSTHPHGRR